MQPVLDAMGVSNRIRFEGVDGARLGEDGVRRMRKSGLLAADTTRFDPNCAEGEIGCALSHAGVLRDIADRGWGSALVLEDDVVLAGSARSWRRRCERAFSDLPLGWELWYLYRCFDIRHRTKRVTRRTLVPFTPQGGAAYAVSLAGARKLLAAMTPVADAVDRVYAELVRWRTIEAWAASPLLILPGSQPSIINRDNAAREWVNKGINRPPEYWPELYLPGLGERPPLPWHRRVRENLAANARGLLAGRRNT